MKAYIFIFVSLFSLIGCEKVKKQLGVGLDHPSGHATQLTPGNTAIFVLAGQSNAVGLGQSYPSAMPTNATWRGLDFPRGIGASFAEYYIVHGHGPVIIAHCAVGGTSIYEWQAGGGLFKQCLQIVQNIKNDTPNTQLAGILFWQGEYDAKSPGVPWASIFQSIIRGFRFEFGDNQLPIMFCQLDTNQQFGQAPFYPYWSDIKLQQAGVYSAHTQMIVTDDITTLSDSVHVNATGLYTIGQRLGQAYEDLINE